MDLRLIVPVLQDFVAGLRPQDAVDVAVVAFLFYRLLLALQGSRAWRILAGVAALLALYGLGEVLGLTTLTWLMDRFGFYVVLAIVLLFQEDLRRALTRMGNPLFGASHRQEDVAVIPVIARACFRLADQGHGALIAVERDARLDELAEGAVLVDGALSLGLLVSVFQPESPIHDGAVILRKDRVWVAGAFFPLSTRTDLPKEYGTRHRAAIGQTEANDCLVFLVSEERRTVSLAWRGELYPVDTPDELRLRVNELLTTARIDPRTEPRPGATGAFAPVRTSGASLPPVSGEDPP